MHAGYACDLTDKNWENENEMLQWKITWLHSITERKTTLAGTLDCINPTLYRNVNIIFTILNFHDACQLLLLNVVSARRVESRHDLQGTVWIESWLSSVAFFTITAEIHARSLAKFYGQYAYRHMNLKFVGRVSKRKREIRQFVIVENKLMSVFNASVLLLTMKLVITLSK